MKKTFKSFIFNQIFIFVLFFSFFIFHNKSFALTFTAADITNDNGSGVQAVCGDVNNDGHPDIFVAQNHLDNRLWLNDGQGRFTLSNIPGQPENLWSYGALMFDVDNDSDLDIYVVNDNGGQNELWINDGLGNGGASFSSSNITGDTGISSKAVFADFDNDGDQDIFVANRNSTKNVLWINDGLGNGGASFSASSFFIYTENSKSVAAGDLNNDGYMDIYISNTYTQNRLWLNDGDGTFTLTCIYGDEGNSVDAVIFDVDNDGDQDIYVSNYNEQNKLWINDGLGNGGASFTASNITGDEGDSYRIAVSDIDVDGDIDIYAADYYQNKIWINDGLGNGGASFTLYEITNDDRLSKNALIHDFNHDEKPDIYVMNANGQPSNLWINNNPNAQASYTASDISGDFGNSRGIAIGDIDNDGDQDCYVSNYSGQNKLWVSDGLGNGEASFSAGDISGDTGNSYGAVICDIDNDGDQDIYTAVYGGQNKLWINDGLGNGGTSFSASDITGDADNSYTAASADIDNDGDLDIYTCNRNGQNKLWINDGLGNGGTSFSSSDITGDTGDSFDVDIIDIDNDGDLDIYVTNEGGEQNKLWINDGLGNGGSSFTASDISGDTTDSEDATFGDIDNDGDLDIYTSNYSGQNKLWINDGLGNGGASFSAADISGDTGPSRGTAMGDIDNDGDLDIYVTNLDKQNKLWINDGLGNGGASFSAADISGDIGESCKCAIWDIDNDGDLDIYVTNVNQQNKLWINTLMYKPLLSSMGGVVDTVDEDTQVEITFAEIADMADESDLDGTVDSFIVKSILSGTLKIGHDPAASQAWSSLSNNSIDPVNNAYWTPEENTNGIFSAFEVTACDNDGLESETRGVACQVEVSPVNDSPVFFKSGKGMVFSPWSNESDKGSALVQQPDGKILVAGSSTVSGSKVRFALFRFNSDGSLDNTFGGNGKTTFSCPASGDSAKAIALQDDGKIIIGGYSVHDFMLFRCSSEGILDNTFGTNGRVITDFNGGRDEIRKVMIQDDGKIVAAGYANRRIGVVRYNSDGTLDTGFGTEGKAVFAIGEYQDECNSAFLQPDGKIVLAGSCSGPPYEDIVLVRMNTDGTLDTGFGTEGKVRTSLSGYQFGYDAALQSDGKIVVSGKGYNNNSTDFFVLRYNTDGTLDTTFNSTGYAYVDHDYGTDFANSLVIQDDGKIFLAGYLQTPGANHDFFAARLNTDGTLDTSFNEEGYVRTVIEDSHEKYLDSIQQFDGKLVSVGCSIHGSDHLVISRYNLDGTFDTDFGRSALPGSNIDYNENDVSIIMRPDLAVEDLELNMLNSGKGNYSGVVLSVSRNGGALAEDVFNGSGDLAPFVHGGELLYSGVTVGTVTQNTGGILILSFNSNATTKRVTGVLQSLNYTCGTDFPDASVVLKWQLSDGNTGNQGSGGLQLAEDTLTINITEVNDAPTLTSFAGSIKSGDEDSLVEISFDEISAMGNEADSDGSVEAYVIYGPNSGTLKIGPDLSNAQPWHISTNCIVNSSNKAFWTPAENENGQISPFSVKARDNRNLDSADYIALDIDVLPVNDAPFMTVGDTLKSYTENGEPFKLDDSVIIGDIDQDTFNNGLGNYNTSTLVIARHNGPDTSDVFYFDTLEKSFEAVNVTDSTGKLITGAENLEFANFIKTAGTMEINFTSIQTTATSALVKEVFESITYSNSNDDPSASVTIDWTFSDGNTDSQGSGGSLSCSGSTTVNITPVNDAPILPLIQEITKNGTEDTELEILFTDIKTAANESDADGSVVGFAVKSVNNGTLRIGSDSDGASTWSPDTNYIVDSANKAFWIPEENSINLVNAFKITAVDNQELESADQPSWVKTHLSPVNDAPHIVIDETAPSYTENDAPVILDASIIFNDPDLDAFNSGEGNYDFSSLTVSRNPSANPADLFGFYTNGAIFTLAEDKFYSNDLEFANFINANGQLKIFFNSTGTPATTALVRDVMQRITYSNISDDPVDTVQIEWDFFDGNTGTQGAGGPLTGTDSITIEIIPENDPPVFTDMNGRLKTIKEDTLAQISFADIKALAQADDKDGTIQGFIIKKISSGTMKIGETSDTAYDWSDMTNNRVHDSNFIFWTPPANTSGILQAFTITAMDNQGLESSDGPVQGAVQVEIIVDPINDSPQMSSLPLYNMPAVYEKNSSIGNNTGNDSQNPSGTRIDIILADKVTDIEQTEFGILVVQAKEQSIETGKWQYSRLANPEDIIEWIDFANDINEEKALLLKPDSLVRFVSEPGWHGTASIKYHAWDMAPSTNGSSLEAFTYTSLYGQGASDKVFSENFSITGQKIYPCESSILLKQDSCKESHGGLLGCTIEIPFPLDSDSRFLLAASGSGNYEQRLILPSFVTISAGTTFESFDIQINNNDNIDGNCEFTISAVREHWQSQTAVLTITDDEVKTMSLFLPSEVDEGSTLNNAVLKLSGKILKPLTVSFSSDNSLILFPQTITVPAKSDSVQFTFDIKDDTRYTGPLTSLITANAAECAIQPEPQSQSETTTGWTGASVNIVIIDNEEKKMLLTIESAVSEKDGLIENAARIVLKGSIENDLLVNLSSSNTSRLTVPEQVVVPAGSLEQSFSITLVDDTIQNLTDSVTITISDPQDEYASAEKQIFIQDDDYERLLTLSGPAVINESSSLNRNFLTLQVSPVNNEGVLVDITSSRKNVIVPFETITIPANTKSVTLDVTAIDNDFFNTDINVLITASASGFSKSTLTLDIIDDEKRKITINALKTVLKKNGIIKRGASITVPKGTTEELVVSLSSLDTGLIILPESVSLSAGQTIEYFDLTIRDDNNYDQMKKVDIQAYSSGWETGTAEINVFNPPKAEVSPSVIKAGQQNVCLSFYIDPNVIDSDSNLIDNDYNENDTISEVGENNSNEIKSGFEYKTISISFDKKFFLLNPDSGFGFGKLGLMVSDLYGKTINLDGNEVINIEENSVAFNFKNPPGYDDSPLLRPVKVTLFGAAQPNPPTDTSGNSIIRPVVTLIDYSKGMDQICEVTALSGDGDMNSSVGVASEDSLDLSVKTSNLPPLNTIFSEIQPNSFSISSSPDLSERTKEIDLFIAIPNTSENTSDAMVEGLGVNRLSIVFPGIENSIDSIVYYTNEPDLSEGVTLVANVDYTKSVDSVNFDNRIVVFTKSLCASDAQSPVYLKIGCSLIVNAYEEFIEVSGSMSYIVPGTESQAPVVKTLINSGSADGVANNGDTLRLSVDIISLSPELSGLQIDDFYIERAQNEYDIKVKRKARISWQARDRDSSYMTDLFWSVNDLTGAQFIAELKKSNPKLYLINESELHNPGTDAEMKDFEYTWDVSDIHDMPALFEEGTDVSKTLYLYAVCLDENEINERQIFKAGAGFSVVRPISSDENSKPELIFVNASQNDEFTCDTRFDIKFILKDDTSDNVKISLFYGHNIDEYRALECLGSDSGLRGQTYIPDLVTADDFTERTFVWDTSLISGGSYHVMAKIEDMIHKDFNVWTKYKIKVIHEATDNIAPVIKWISPDLDLDSFQTDQDIVFEYELSDENGDDLSVQFGYARKSQISEVREFAKVDSVDTSSGTVTGTVNFNVNKLPTGFYYIYTKIVEINKTKPPVVNWSRFPVEINKGKTIYDLHMASPEADPDNPGKCRCRVSFRTDHVSLGSIEYGFSNLSFTRLAGLKKGVVHNFVLHDLEPGKTYFFSAVARIENSGQGIVKECLDNHGAYYRIRIPEDIFALDQKHYVKGKINTQSSGFVKIYVVKPGNLTENEMVTSPFIVSLDEAGEFTSDIGRCVFDDLNVEVPKSSWFSRVEVELDNGQYLFVDNIELTGIENAVDPSSAIVLKGLWNDGIGADTPDTGIGQSKIVLKKGFNMISLVLEPDEILMASDILNTAGTNAVMVANYDSISGAYKTYIRVEENIFLGTDFKIESGLSFFIKVKEAAEYTFTGQKFKKSKVINLVKGFNMVSIPFSRKFPATLKTGMTARTILERIGDDGLAVYKYINGSYVSYLRVGKNDKDEALFMGEDFEIFLGEGIFIFTRASTSFWAE